MKQHAIFTKYTRYFLHQQTGFSKGYLCRLARGKAPLTHSFIERACFRLGQSETELFNGVSRDTPEAAETCCHGPYGCAGSKFGEWLEGRCKLEHLSLREAATKTELCHTTIADLIKGTKPSAETIRKLAIAFGGDGHHQQAALKDFLLTLAGYRSEHLEEGQTYLDIIPLLTAEHQHITEVLVTEFAKIDAIEIPTLEREKP